MKRYVASHLKDMNRKLVYDLFVSEHQLSRMDICKLTDISAPTVLKIVDFFLRHGLVAEAGEGVAQLGRKPQIYRFCPNAAYTVGIVLEGKQLMVGVANLLGELKAERVLDVTELMTPPVRIDALLGEALIDEVTATLAQAEIGNALLLGACLAVPGQIDARQRVISYANALGILREPLDVGAQLAALEKRLGCPVLLENDVNASAVGELMLRQAKDASVQDLVYILMADGVGAGIIVDGRLLRGRQHGAGEIGKMVIDRAEEGTDASQTLSRQYHTLRLHATDALCAQDTQRVEQVADELAAKVARAVAHIHTVVDVPLAVVGGNVGRKLGQPLVDALRKYVRLIHPFPIQCVPTVNPTANVIGAAAIARAQGIEVFFVD